MKKNPTCLFLSMALFGASSAPSHAASGYTGIHPTMNSAITLWAGAFFSKSDNRFELDSDSGKGTEIDPGDLGIDEKSTVPFVSGRWRFSDRWRVEANWFKTDHSGSNGISERIIWGDLDFEVGANVKIKNDTSIFRGALGYSFLKSERAELGAGVGVHYLDVTTKLSGNATINGEPIIGASEKSSVQGWAPNLAFFGGYAINEQWLVSGRVDWISADIGKLDGKLVRFGGAVIYQPFKHFGFGAGFDWISIDLNKQSSNGKNRLDGDTYGPTLFVTSTFF